jgi:hypothetical protein
MSTAIHCGLASAVAILLSFGCSSPDQLSEKPHPHALGIPQEIAADGSAKELARVWSAGGRQIVILAPNSELEPGHWGILLVDLAKHVAKERALNAGLDEKETLTEIKRMFDLEWEHPTDEPTGRLAQP